MLRTKLAKKVLTKEEQKHLTKMGINSIAAFKLTRIKQLIDRKNSLASGVPIGLAEPCWHCFSISVKLGIEPKDDERRPTK